MGRNDLHELAVALEAAGIVGRHQSHSRSNNISKIHALFEGDPEATFGISGLDRHSAGDILGFLARLTGCSSDLEDTIENDTIDSALTAAAIAAAAEKLKEEARRGAHLLAATGHPTGLLEHHIRVVDAYRQAGGKVIRPLEGAELPVGKRGREIRYVGSVGCLADWGTLKHTHSPEPMEAVLESGEPRPDIVFADHGFAGAAVEAGIPTIAIMDINDPALAVAAAEGRDVIVIPMDDNRAPRLYEPSWRFIESILRS